MTSPIDQRAFIHASRITYHFLMRHRVDFPANPRCWKDRAVNADSFVRFITERRGALDGDDAADADAEAATHGRFKRHQTTDIERRGDFRDAPHHDPRA